MGPKITVDSATLANKGLEIIEAHFLFGVAYDRIEVVIHPTSIVHGLVRFRDGAAIAHLGYPDMRVPISYALTYPERAATPVPPLELRTLEFHEPGRGDVPDARRSAARPASAAARTRAPTTPRTRSPCRRSSSGGSASSRSPRSSRTCSRASTASPARDLDELVEADRRARELVPVALMGITAAILGLAVLILVHEAGHFFVARWVGMRPRKFYLGFGPAAREDDARTASSTGSRAFPLGGYVKIPGMYRPAAGDLRKSLRAGAAGGRRGARSTRSTRRSSATTSEARARRSFRRLEPELGKNRMLQELDGALAPDAYWRQTTWKRVAVIAAGPAHERRSSRS